MSCRESPSESVSESVVRDLLLARVLALRLLSLREPSAATVTRTCPSFTESLARGFAKSKLLSCPESRGS